MGFNGIYIYIMGFNWALTGFYGIKRDFTGNTTGRSPTIVFMGLFENGVYDSIIPIW
jgi:hypothetical protein